MATYSDLTRAVETGSYRTATDEHLRELIAAALDIGGANPIALHRITHAADILKKELASREANRHEQAEQQRHQVIHSQLSELKKTHWTVLPNFWITVIAAVSSIASAYLAWLALQK